jgi:dTDP-4-dehydrorhamnose 3,5-epimerase
MRFVETPIGGAYLVELEPRGDERGWFARVWCQDEFARHGLSAGFVQCNTSYSRDAGTLRGLHYQTAPHDEAKLVRCLRGRIYDVMVDVRPASPTYGQWFGVELTAANRTMLYVAPGLAHGFQALEDETEVMYPVTAAYAPQSERGVRWDDPFFAITWPLAARAIVSPKDRTWPDFVPESPRAGAGAGPNA